MVLLDEGFAQDVRERVTPAGEHSHIWAPAGRGGKHSYGVRSARVSLVAMLFGPAAVGSVANTGILHGRVSNISKYCNGMGS